MKNSTIALLLFVATLFFLILGFGGLLGVAWLENVSKGLSILFMILFLIVVFVGAARRVE